MRVLFFLLVASMLATPVFAQTTPAPTAASPSPSVVPIQLVIDSPASGSRVESKMHMAEIRGTASAGGEGPKGFDVMIVLDVSKSTENASGADVDGDGQIGEDPTLGLYAPGEYPEGTRSTDPEDTILHAEIKAAHTMLEGLDPRRVRVGLISFSGASDPKTSRRAAPEQHDATLRSAISSNYDGVRASLSEVLAEGPHGATNFAAAIRLATRELAGMSGAKSRPRGGFKKVILFLTDGIPSFPAGLATVMDPEDLEAAVRAARVAQAAGIRINSFALGTNALTRPKAATEIARVTLGTFTPVVEPGSIVGALQSVTFANVEDVGMLNLTTKEHAPDVQLNPDGSFVAFVPVQVGRNRLLINALSSDGQEINREIEIDFALKEDGTLDKKRELERLRRMNDNLRKYELAKQIKRERERRARMEKQLDITPDLQ